MIVTAVWTVVLIAVVGWELHCRSGRHRWAGLADIVAAASRRRAGLLLVIAIWAFAGLHLFARYTVPR